MRDLLDPGVYTAIEAQYRAARPLSESDYEGGREEEDSLTGAVMKGLQDSLQGEHEGFVWRTSVSKLRGRGPGALERRTGADVMIEIEVRDRANNVTGQKGLLGQAKTDWGSRDGRLVEQARRMEEVAPGAAVVVDYTRQGATACSATAAIDADGRRRGVAEGSMKPLGELLAEDFLTCRVGARGMSYDRSRKQIVYAAPSAILRIGYVMEFHLLTTVGPLGLRGTAGWLRRRPRPTRELDLDDLGEVYRGR